MKTLPVSLGLISLLFCAGCGTSSVRGAFGTSPNGNFSNADLKGSYTYQIAGYDLSSTTSSVPFREAGVFTADGNGNITSGTDDFSEGGGVASDPTTGSYSISNDGTGSVTINFGNGGAIILALTLIDSSKAYLAVVQGVNTAGIGFPQTGTGIAEQQSTSAFSAVPDGTFVFQMHSISGVQGSSSTVGQFALSSGIATGNDDVMRSGVQSSLALNGSFNSPDTSGRGTGTFTDSANVTSSFVYYIVDASNLRLFSTTPGVIGLGRAELQSGTPFTTASFSGGYAFGSRGDDNFAIGGVNTVGRFTAGGDGTIQDGVYDSVQDGTSSASVSFTGSYTMASSGRAMVTLNPSVGGTVQQIFWLVNPSRAFFLTNDPNKVEDGTVDLQQSTSFSDSTMNGQYAVAMDGFISNAGIYDRVGTLHWDGASNLALNEFINISGSTNTPGFIKGSYSVSSNGRATGSISGLSSNLVFYLISASDGYLLQNDTGVEINGMMSKQP